MPNHAAAIRASVERGDPLAVFRTITPCEEHTFTDYTLFTAGADPPEADPPEAVAADPEPLDAETDGDYPHGVQHGHPVEFAPTGTTREAAPRAAHTGAASAVSGVGMAERRGGRAPTGRGEAGSTPAPCGSWSESDRLAFLARVQRIDPRT